MSNYKKKHVKLNYFRVCMTFFLMLLIIFGLITAISSCSKGNVQSAQSINTQNSVVNKDVMADVIDATKNNTTTEPTTLTYPSIDTSAKAFTADYGAKYAIIIDTSNNSIVAQKAYDTKMFPASLTKMMSLIVAADYIKNNNIDYEHQTYLITAEMIDPMIAAEASRAGFAADETPTIKDLLYGMILPSGADATMAIADYVAGSEGAFVDLMNQKAQQIGLKSTHFTNPVGLHDVNHYSTAQDMALILEYAIKNDLCKTVLSTYEYTVPASEYNPDGILLTSTMFGRMNGTEMPGVTIKGGKTGYTDEAGNCLADFAEINGKTYIMVLAGEPSKWTTIYDTLSGFSVYCAGGQAYVPPANQVSEEDDNY